MIITKIVLTNWGPHKSLTVDFNANMVGISGPNGSGKSELLTALDYALTGNTDRNLEEYIHNFESPDSPTSASVVVEWNCRGKFGRIKRTVNRKSAKPELLWDGQTYQSAAKVDQMLQEIFCADKSAITNAVMTKQGDIDSLVCGTPTARLTIMHRLMGLAFLDPRARQINTKITKLQASVQDVRPQLRNAEEMLTTHQKRLAEAEVLAATNPDMSDKLESWSKISKTWDKVREADRLHVAARNKWNNWILEQNLPEDMASAIQELQQSVSTYEGCIAELQQTRAAAVETEAVCGAQIMGFDMWEEAQNDLAVATSQWASAMQRLLEFSPDMPSTALLACSTLQAELGVWHTYQTWQQSYAQHTASLQTAQQELMQAQKTYQEVTQAHSTRFENETELTRIAQLREKLQHALIRLRLQKEEQCTSPTCPMCGSVRVPLTPEQVAQLQQEAITMQQEVQTFDAMSNSSKQRVTAAENKLAGTQAVLDSVQLQLSILENNKPAQSAYDSAQEIKQQIADQQELLHNYNCAQQGCSHYQKEVAKWQEKVDFLSQHGVTDDAAVRESHYAAMSTITDCDTKIALYNQGLRERQVILNTGEHMRNGYTSALNYLLEAQEQLNAALAGEAGIEETLPYEQVDSYIAESLKIVQEQQAAWLANQTLLRSIKEDVKYWQESCDTYNAQIAQNEERLNLISDLQTIQALMGKQGVPLTYMMAMFEQVTAVAVDLLSQMGANFSIIIDKEQPMTYRILRHGDPNAVPLPQHLLSGGQAIRLALALLIAFQRVMLPEVGLLVLDEPTTHVDAEGVAAMRALFTQLVGLCKEADMQIIVADHNPDLQAALEKNHTLKSLIAR